MDPPSPTISVVAFSYYLDSFSILCQGILLFKSLLSLITLLYWAAPFYIQIYLQYMRIKNDFPVWKEIFEMFLFLVIN